MPKKVLFWLIIIYIVLFYTGCGSEPPYYRVLPVPFFWAEGYQWCTVACIQMWAHYDGNTHVGQAEIASYVGVPTLPDDAVNGVNYFTDSAGWMEWEPDTKYGQELTIASSIACVDDRCPSIIPVHGGTHAILAIGFKWHRNAMGTPIADFMTSHDPDQGERLEMTGDRLMNHYFLPVQSRYYVIVGARWHVTRGASGLADYKAAGGTYYGEDPDDPTVPQQ
ncbi:MAG: hypothetical protein GTN53_09735 [Candidatus Aminicenantes bacterium]|nr:hypothetical protein [Candidatus Aminicenantes bacterium]NIQ67090.1 hypothetical protein [Candidatus Aminicenantes bacterium]NIT22772.1 hypothetical protein [Candidatus Aminicenantes bacterium]